MFRLFSEDEAYEKRELERTLRLKHHEPTPEEERERLSYGLSAKSNREPERWEVERERMENERDTNQETCDRYGDL